MTEQEQQRLANLEAAVMAMLAHMTAGGMDLDRVARELFDCGVQLGGFRISTIDTARSPIDHRVTVIRGLD